MYLASLKQKYKTKEMVTTFKGYSHREVIGDGEWYEMTNMSARKYPAITTRPKRQIVSMVNGEAVSNVAAMVDMDGLVWLGKDGSLHAGGHSLENFYTYTEADRQLVPMGGYLVVFPDKVWANAVKLKLGGEMIKDTDYGALEAYWEQRDERVVLYPCQENGDFWLYVPPGYEVLREPDKNNEYIDKNYIDISQYPYTDHTIGSYTDENGETIEVHNFNPYWGYHVLQSAPKAPGNGYLWLDVSGDTPVMKRWHESTKMWGTVDLYMRIQSKELTKDFSAGDCVTINIPGIYFEEDSYKPDGSYKYEINQNGNTMENVKITAVGESEYLTQYISSEIDFGAYVVVKGTVRLWQPIETYHEQLVICAVNAQVNQQDDAVEKLTKEQLRAMTDDELKARIDGMTDSKNGFSYDQMRSVSISRNIPDMDYVIESNNRLWGCFYGEKDGKILNEIYASKLGDFKNWNSFQGLSTDSYAASRGTDGPWTGAITMNNYPLFFKRNCLEKVYVSASGAHQIATTKQPGVQPGSWRSMQIVDGVLIYLSDTGVMVYDGSLPDHISSDFGEVKYKNGVAGKQGYNYYLSVEAQDGTHSLFNLDTTKGVWNREDDTQLVQAADRGDVLYMLTADGRLLTPGSLAELDTGELEEDFTWEIISGAIGYQRAEQEYLLRLIPRIKLEPGGSAVMHVMYDDNGDWQRVGCIENYSTHSVTIPVKTRRCDHFRIKLSGIGGATLYTIVREIEKGSLEG